MKSGNNTKKPSSIKRKEQEAQTDSNWFNTPEWRYELSLNLRKMLKNV